MPEYMQPGSMHMSDVVVGICLSGIMSRLVGPRSASLMLVPVPYSILDDHLQACLPIPTSSDSITLGAPYLAWCSCKAVCTAKIVDVTDGEVGQERVFVYLRLTNVVRDTKTGKSQLYPKFS